MKNGTKFLDDLMKNDIQKYLIIDVTDKPTFQDWWRFESECLNEHFGCTLEDSKEWWNTWFTTSDPCNFILINIGIENGIYVLKYITEVEEFEDLESRYSGVPCIMSFPDIYNKYMLEPLPEPLTEIKDDKRLRIEDTECCGVGLSPSEWKVKTPIQDLLDYLEPTEGEQGMQIDLEDLKEENELLQETIKDMEAQINKLNTILEFVWTMLENKIKEDK